ncbi:MAG: aminotransferase class I/II-fold pyridoxal phosphate-dependent enzyme [Bdellovibrionota bacterium]
MPSTKKIQLAKRMKHFQSSGIRKMFELASKMQNPIDLSLGQPDFDVPEQVKEAAISAIKSGKNGYTQTRGIQPLQEAITSSLNAEGIPHETSMITSGASGGILLALLALVDRGDEVLITDPGFVAYNPMIRLAGATPIPIDIYPDFKLTPEKLKAAITPNSKVLIFNSPGNPTGIMHTKEEIAALVEVIKEYDIQVIADEVYNLFTYSTAHESLLKHDPNAILIRAFSKSWGMPGWRSGYAAGPERILNQMITLQQFTYVCVNQPTQWACIEALKTDISHLIKEYEAKRDLVYEGLKDYFDIIKPTGAFFMFPKSPHGDTDTFLNKCIEKEVLIVPGKAFSNKNTHFRLSFANKNSILEQGIEKLITIAKS